MNESQVFTDALKLATAAERTAYLDQACAGNPQIRAALVALLQAHARDPGFLEQPVSSLSGTVDSTTASDAAAPPEADGVLIAGKYKLVEQIGEGGMGTVWMAQQTEPVKRLVAVKLIKAGMDSSQVIARFEAERQALALMDHTNIARVLDAGATNSGRPYFVMDLVKGMPITRYCDEHHLTPRQRLELFIPVCQAVQHAHQKGIIHRDLKPSNVLVALYDGKPVPKVIDFGVAKAAGQQLTDKTLVTGFGAIVGTLEYMSPEQAEVNQLDIDTRSDIYALGVLLYELLAGSTPFTKKDLEKAGMLEMLRVIREDEPSKPSTKLSSSDALPTLSANRGTEPAKLTKLVRGELDWIVMRALEKDRGRRYETANAFAADVQRYLADEPVLACPPSPVYRLRKFARRNKAGLAIAGLILFFMVLLGGGAGWMVRDRAARQAESAQQVRESLIRARGLIGENKLALARAELAEGKGRMGNDRAALAGLAAEIEALEEEVRAREEQVKAVDAELGKYQTFLALIDQAHQAETAPSMVLVLHEETSENTKSSLQGRGSQDRDPTQAVPFLSKALSLYGVIEHEDWDSRLTGGLLGSDQVKQIRRTVYEELVWLANDIIVRQEDHRTGQKLSAASAAHQGLAYLQRAEAAHQPTLAFYRVRSGCGHVLQDTEAAQRDAQRARKVRATIALDHYLLGEDARLAKDRSEGLKQFQAALRLEPTHYWSLMSLGYCLGDLGKHDQDWVAALAAFTGCIMKRPDHAYAYFWKGMANSRLRRHEEALTDYAKALELKPDYALAWHNRGWEYQNLRQYDKALADYAKALELKPDLVAAWHNRGYLFQELQQYDKALPDYSKALELKPDTVEVWHNRGWVYEKLRQYHKAHADFNKALMLKPDFVAAWNGRGSVYGDLRQYDKALADYNKALELDPDNAQSWNHRGILYCDHLRQYDKALADFNKALTLNSDEAIVWHNRGNVYSNLGQYDKALADFNKALVLRPDFVLAWNSRGNVHIYLGQYDTALADFNKALTLNPDEAIVWRNRSIVYINLGRYDKALADCSRALELKPDFELAWNRRGEVHKHLRQYDKALADYSKALELKPDYASAWYNRGALYCDHLRQYDKALADFNKALELNPADANSWCSRGIVYFHLRQYDKALADYSKALELKPADVNAWYGRGLVYFDLRQYDKALADYSKALELKPDYVAALNKRGLLYEDLKQYDKALADFSKVVEVQSRNPAALNRVAWLLVTCPDVKVRDPGRAIEMAKKTIELAPKEGYWLTLGWAYYRVESWKAALEAAEKAMPIRKGGDCADWFLLAMVHWKLGDKEKARQWYDRANQWMDKHSHVDWPRLRDEAAALLGLSAPPVPPKDERKLPPKK